MKYFFIKLAKYNQAQFLESIIKIKCQGTILLRGVPTEIDDQLVRVLIQELITAKLGKLYDNLRNIS